MNAPYHANPPISTTSIRCCFGSQRGSAFSYPPSVAALGVIQTFALPVTTPFKLTAGAWLWLASPLPVKVITDNTENSAQIACEQGVYVKAQSETKPLSRHFAMGWSKLPDELKIQIIEKNLKFESAVDSHDTDGKDTCLMLRGLHHHLRTTPEIAELAKQIFYTSNTFLLRRASSSHWFVPTLRFPSPRINNLVRWLRFEIRLGSRKEWRYLIQLAGGDYGFCNLRYVHLVLNWKLIPWEFTEDPSEEVFKGWLSRRCMGNVIFKCKGSIVFEDQLVLDIETVVPEAVQHRFETMLRFKIGFEEDPADGL